MPPGRPWAYPLGDPRRRQAMLDATPYNRRMQLLEMLGIAPTDAALGGSDYRGGYEPSPLEPPSVSALQEQSELGAAGRTPGTFPEWVEQARGQDAYDREAALHGLTPTSEGVFERQRRPTDPNAVETNFSRMDQAVAMMQQDEPAVEDIKPDKIGVGEGALMGLFSGLANFGRANAEDYVGKELARRQEQADKLNTKAQQTRLERLERKRATAGVLIDQERDKINAQQQADLARQQRAAIADEGRLEREARAGQAELDRKAQMDIEQLRGRIQLEEARIRETGDHKSAENLRNMSAGANELFRMYVQGDAESGKRPLKERIAAGETPADIMDDLELNLDSIPGISDDAKQLQLMKLQARINDIVSSSAAPPTNNAAPGMFEGELPAMLEQFMQLQQRARPQMQGMPRTPSREP